MRNNNKIFHPRGREVEVTVRQKSGGTEQKTVTTGPGARTMKLTEAWHMEEAALVTRRKSEPTPKELYQDLKKILDSLHAMLNSNEDLVKAIARAINQYLYEYVHGHRQYHHRKCLTLAHLLQQGKSREEAHEEVTLLSPPEFDIEGWKTLATQLIEVGDGELKKLRREVERERAKRQAEKRARTEPARQRLPGLKRQLEAGEAIQLDGETREQLAEMRYDGEVDPRLYERIRRADAEASAKAARKQELAQILSGSEELQAIIAQAQMGREVVIPDDDDVVHLFNLRSLHEHGFIPLQVLRHCEWWAREHRRMKLLLAEMQHPRHYSAIEVEEWKERRRVKREAEERRWRGMLKGSRYHRSSRDKIDRRRKWRREARKINNNAIHDGWH